MWLLFTDLQQTSKKEMLVARETYMSDLIHEDFDFELLHNKF